MKPVRTEETNFVYKLPGGSDENDLPCTRFDGKVGSVWELDEEDVEALVKGRWLAIWVWLPNRIAFNVMLAKEYDGEDLYGDATVDEDGRACWWYALELSDDDVRHIETGGKIALTVDCTPPPAVALVAREPARSSSIESSVEFGRPAIVQGDPPEAA